VASATASLRFDVLRGASSLGSLSVIIVSSLRSLFNSIERTNVPLFVKEWQRLDVD
jgi:hypothetical protein